jgi:hypothetical protein
VGNTSGHGFVASPSASGTAHPVGGDLNQGGTDSTSRRSVKTGGRFRTTPETVTNNQRIDDLVDPQGRTEVLLRAVSGGVTATGAAGAGVVLTIPAAGAGLYHHICHIEIRQYAAIAQVGAAAPTVVTSTNLPGANAWTFKTVLPIGEAEPQITEPTDPIRSSVANTATTIVCPAVAGIIWRVNVYYYSSTQT